MRGLLLAGGLGTRLRPYTERVPKCLIPILGRPLLDYWLDLTLGQGMERVLVNTHYLAEQVRAHVGASRWRDQIELVHEDQLLGTAGTILRNRAFLGEKTFLVAHADNLTRFDLKAYVARHSDRPAGVLATMMTFHTSDPQTCGIVEEDTRGVVMRFHEKIVNPPGNLANGAIYLFEPELFAVMAGIEGPVSDLSTQVLPQLMGRMQSHPNSDYLRDIGTVASLRLAEAEFGHLAMPGRELSNGVPR